MSKVIVYLLAALMLTLILVPAVQSNAASSDSFGWINQISGTNEHLRSVSAVDINTAWVVGDNGTVLKTSDGWTWNTQAVGITAHDLHGVSAPDVGNAWAVGENGLILNTKDGGDNWSIQPWGNTTVLHGVSAVDANTCWAVGGGGTIIKTVDGINWNPQVSGTTKDLWGVAAVNTDTAWAVGDDGTIMKTTDGGVNWNAQASNTTSDLRGVCAVDSNNAWAVGWNINLLVTNDGSTWFQPYPLVPAVMFCRYGVSAVDADTAWMVDDFGRIIMVTDNDMNWVLQHEVPSALYSVSAVNTEVVWAAGDSGTVLRTDDGGGLASTWFHAEGSTSNGFETWLLTQNPGKYPARLQFTINGDTISLQEPFLDTGRGSYLINSYIESSDVSTVIEAFDAGVICERAMYWISPGSDQRVLGHCSLGTTSAAPIWYLPEGCTAGGFETWVLVHNPGSHTAIVDLMLHTSHGETAPAELQEVEIPGGTRRSFLINDHIQTYDVSTIVVAIQGEVVCERAVYWTPPGSGEKVLGHCSIGATSAAPLWYLPEGCTAGGFETWVLVQNPGAVPVHVDLTLHTDMGDIVLPELQNREVPARSRESFCIDDYLETYHVSTVIEARDGEVVCDRAVYWTSPGADTRTLGHCSIGATSADSTWFLTEGCTDGGFETWILVQNPDEAPVHVDLTLATDAGPQVVAALYNIEIPPKSRRSFNIGDFVTTFDVSTLVECRDGEVICERAMYWTPDGENFRVLGHDSIGYTP